MELASMSTERFQTSRDFPLGFPAFSLIFFTLAWPIRFMVGVSTWHGRPSLTNLPRAKRNNQSHIRRREASRFRWNCLGGGGNDDIVTPCWYSKDLDGRSNWRNDKSPQRSLSVGDLVAFKRRRAMITWGPRGGTRSSQSDSEEWLSPSSPWSRDSGIGAAVRIDFDAAVLPHFHDFFFRRICGECEDVGLLCHELVSW